MLKRQLLSAVVLAWLPLASIAAEGPIVQDKEACKRQEQREGKGDKTSDVVCALKIMFQNRIRRKKDEEPGEMIVGSPPMLTDDTDTPGDKNWEINLLAHGEIAGREHRIEGPVADINHGVGDRLQLTYELPYVFQAELEPTASGERVVHAHGIGDSTLGVKYRFYDNEDTGLSFAIYPQIEFRTPGAKRDVSEGATALIVPLIMTREFEHASIGANVGVEATAHEHRYFASFGVGKRVTHNVALMAEIVGDDLNASDEKRVLLNFGLRRKLNATQTLSASFGRDVYAGGDQRRNNYFSIAYQKQFGD
jgi:hypothetical protein